MSVRAIAWAWEQDTETQSAKLVLLALADHADHDGVCWPGMRHVEAKAGVSRRTVFRAISSLTKAGLIEADERTRDDGGRSSNLYRLVIEPRSSGHDDTGGGDTVARGVVSPRHGGGVTTSPPIEPSVESSKGKYVPSDDGTTDPEKLSVRQRYPSKPPKRSGQYQYPPEFEAAWSAYPGRSGGNPKLGAYKQWRARLVSGDDPGDIEAATRHYGQTIAAKGDEGSEFVMMAQTFFGSSEPWREFVDGPKVSANGKRPQSSWADGLKLGQDG